MTSTFVCVQTRRSCRTPSMKSDVNTGSPREPPLLPPLPPSPPSSSCDGARQRNRVVELLVAGRLAQHRDPGDGDGEIQTHADRIKGKTRLCARKLQSRLTGWKWHLRYSLLKLMSLKGACCTLCITKHANVVHGAIWVLPL